MAETSKETSVADVLEDEPRVLVIGATLAALAASGAARFAMGKVWRLATGRKAPVNAADPSLRTWEAVAWALIAGAATGLARMAVQRQAATIYLHAKKEPPSTKIDSGS